MGVPLQGQKAGLSVDQAGGRVDLPVAAQPVVLGAGEGLAGGQRLGGFAVEVPGRFSRQPTEQCLADAVVHESMGHPASPPSRGESIPACALALDELDPDSLRQHGIHPSGLRAGDSHQQLGVKAQPQNGRLA